MPEPQVSINERNRCEAAAYRALVAKMNNLLHHAGDERKVNVSGIKRALAMARSFANSTRRTPDV